MWIQLSIVPAIPLSLFLFAGSSRPVFAQGNHCDPGLHQSADDSYGYHLRGDRCEGIYIREVGGTTLFVVSLTESVEDFNPATNQNLQVQWTAPGGASVHLRAYALRHRLYYRMDSLRPSGSKSYVWSPNLLATLNLRKNDLGFVAWMSHPVGNAKREVYLPLRITQQTAASKSNRYNLVLLPGTELAEVFISLAPVKPDGKPGAYIKKNEALRWGYYPAERGITIALPELKSPGIYYLEIGATLRAGGSSTAQVWFYHHN